jgi:hypothetical protein
VMHTTRRPRSRTAPSARGRRRRSAGGLGAGPPRLALPAARVVGHPLDGRFALRGADQLSAVGAHWIFAHTPDYASPIGLPLAWGPTGPTPCPAETL